jgi:hypothetical protein
MATPEVAYTETEGIREWSMRISGNRSVEMKHGGETYYGSGEARESATE